MKRTITPEEYLNKHCFENDLCRLEGGLNDGLWTNNVIKYMEGYAEYRIQKYIDDNIETLKNLNRIKI